MPLCDSDLDMYIGTTFYMNVGGGKFVEDTLSIDFIRNKEFASGFGMPCRTQWLKPLCLTPGASV